MAGEETAGSGRFHVRPEDMRAGDADREVMLERLRAAHAEGRLDADEFEERVTATLAARTYGELAALAADLPGDPPSPRPLAPPAGPARPPAPRADPDVDLRRGAVAWGWISAVAIALWVVASLTTGAFVFPWWIFVAAPWGLGLLWAVRQQRRD